MAESNDGGVKMVERVVALLRALAEAGPHGASLAELSLRTGLRKGTTHRLLAALLRTGFAFQNVGDRFYRLGSQASALGWTAARHQVAATALPALVRLAARSADTVFASVREGLAAVCVAREVGAFPIRTLTLDVGDRRPLGVGAGSLALMAALPDAEIDAVLERNMRWLGDYRSFAADDIRRLVERTRRDGYSLNEGRIVPGMNAVGVAACDGEGTPIAALSIAAIHDRMTSDRVPELASLLQAEAHDLANALSAPRVAA